MSPDDTAPAPTLGRKPSGFLTFWKKKPRSPVPGNILESDVVLPPELWLEILAETPEHALEPISRVCKRLRQIVLPLFFRSQQVFPFLETFAFRRLSMSLELSGYQERSLQRLNFLSADHISPAVRELFVSPYPPGYNRRHKVEHRPVEDVMQHLLVVLPRLPALSKLVLHFPIWNDTLFSSLVSLQLESFELEGLPIARGEIPIPAQKEFFFDRSTSPTQFFPPRALSLRFMFPDSLERLVVGPAGTDTITRALLAHPSGFPSLQTLDLSLRFAASPDFAAALAACPNLTSIRLRSSLIDGSGIPTSLPPLPQTTIPRLTSYHGPLGLTPTFAHSRSLRTVRLWSTHGVSAVCTPSLLPPVLRQIGATVHSLELGVTTVPAALLESIRDAFPALAHLAINAHLDAFHPGSVERRVLPTALRARAALPPGLRLTTLRLGAQLSGTSHAELCESALETVAAFPGGYDPTSWRRWVVDQPWYCIEWTRAPDADVSADGGDAPGGLEGTLRVEYDDHYFQSFERGARISSRTVEEAILHIA
ncbi:hypothetical protein DFH09DRAFT_1287707 [Mycena vulgaris]|nr:hypothetical protein DFH09DRAFT_1287707 [Mycena vulgaris]